MRKLLGALLLALISACDAGAGADSRPATLYFFHAGESDRPLMPFVLAAARPPDDELVAVLGEPWWRNVDVFLLPAPDLAFTLARVRDLAVEAAGEQPGFGYGTYRVTVVTPDARRALHLDPARSAELFREIAERIGASHPKCRAYLQALALRFEPS